MLKPLSIRQVFPEKKHFRDKGVKGVKGVNVLNGKWKVRNGK